MDVFKGAFKRNHGWRPENGNGPEIEKEPGTPALFCSPITSSIYLAAIPPIWPGFQSAASLIGITVPPDGDLPGCRCSPACLGAVITYLA